MRKQWLGAYMFNMNYIILKTVHIALKPLLSEIVFSRFRIALAFKTEQFCL